MTSYNYRRVCDKCRTELYFTESCTVMYCYCGLEYDRSGALGKRPNGKLWRPKEKKKEK